MKKQYLIWGGVAIGVIGVIALIAKARKKSYSDYADKAMSSAIDNKSGSNIKSLHPKVQPKVVDLLNKEKAAGYNLLITSGLRDCDAQNKLYAKGRTAPGSVVTNAKCGESSHNFGTAIDVVPIENGKVNYNTSNWNKIADIAKKQGFQWGGDWKGFKDKPHLEYNFGLSLKQMQGLVAQKRTNNGFIIV